jgi:two-component system LytT family response regulator
MKALIVEDEPLARQLIAQYLSVEKQISAILEASNGFDAVRIINKEHPDIVFLDVELPKLNGMEVLELIDFQPAIIFTTAYDHYAISAFEKNAVDYLLKPFSEDRFRQALGKVLNNEFTGIKDLKNEMPGTIERVEKKKK